MSFLATEETTVRDLDVEVCGLGVAEGITKFSMEGFAFIIVPFIHGTRTRFRRGRGGTSGMGKGFKCNLPNCR